MAVINGATSADEVTKTVKGGFLAVIRVCTYYFRVSYDFQVKW